MRENNGKIPDAIARWLNGIGYEGYTLRFASDDASYRRYFRLDDPNETRSYIVMDASLQPESLVPFVDIAYRLEKAGVHVPKIVAKEMQQGYLLLEDLGTTHLLDIVATDTVESLYRSAIDTLVCIQKVSPDGLPEYDRTFMLQETALMRTWYLEKWLGYRMPPTEASQLESVCEHIVEEVLRQPGEIFVHRDYHSRNLMVTSEGKTAVIDFQDARRGPITYDLVSLLKDSYVEIDTRKRRELALYFRDRKEIDVDDETFLRWFDYTGLQRHIKVLGIFARLYLRDGKKGYLKDIPLTRAYVIETAKRYDETAFLVTLFEKLSNGA